MIRINLLGQLKPKATRRPVDTGAAMPLLFSFSADKSVASLTKLELPDMLSKNELP